MKTTKTNKVVWLTRMGRGVEMAEETGREEGRVTVLVLWPSAAKRTIDVQPHAVHETESAAYDHLADVADARIADAIAARDRLREKATAARNRALMAHKVEQRVVRVPCRNKFAGAK